jgi:transposase
MARFKFYQSDPTFLLPQRVGDMIPDDDISWVIMEVVDRLDVSMITNKYSVKGCDGFHPTLLLKLIFYGVATGNRSSRKIARLARKDVGGIMLCGGQKPSWRTIARFLKVNEIEVKKLFLQVLQLCIALDMISFGQFSLDGTKIKANAFKGGSIKAEVIEKRILALNTEIEQALSELQTNDQTENAQYGQSTADELPQEIRSKQKRLEKLDQALTELKARAETKGEKLQPDDRYNFVDPDSRLMKTSRNGYQQCYNHQAIVDGKERVIVAYTTSQEANDREQLQPTLKESKTNTGRDPEKLIADTGYFSGKNLAGLKESPIDAYICPEQEVHDYHKDKFTYDVNRDLYICPVNRELAYRSTRKKRKDTIVRIYWGDCAGCPNCSKCIKSKTGKRQIERDQHEPLREKMRVKFQTDKAKEIFSLRKELSEPVFGQIKQQQNFQQHLHRGLNPVNSEFGLVCLVYNIKRIWHKYEDYPATRNALESLEPKTCLS